MCIFFRKRGEGEDSKKQERVFKKWYEGYIEMKTVSNTSNKKKNNNIKTQIH